MPAYRTRDTHSRSLDVTVDNEATTPTLNIISPTPRAFTFPINTSSPAPSPSNSPFEPDFRQLTFTPPPKKTHTPSSSISSMDSFLSMDSTANSSPAAPPAPAAPERERSHRRRRSTASEINERRPKKGDQDYVKRPENAFILFRRKCCEDRNLALDAKDAGEDGKPTAPTKKQRQADLSKAISQQWKALPADERQYWEDLAKEKKKEHELLYPHYVYRPQRVKKGKGAAASGNDKGKGKGGQDGETDAEGVSFMVPVPAVTRSGRRAVSAPTPPLAYQHIQIPQLFMPSTPTSPSMVPMTARRDSFATDEFDFASADCLQENAFNQPQGWNPEIHGGSDVVQNMFDAPMYGGAKQDAPLQSLMIPQVPMFETMPLTADSSGPPSPHHGPWTPTHTHGADGFPHSNPIGFMSGHEPMSSTLEIVNLPHEAWQAQDELCVPRSQTFDNGAGGEQQFGYQPYSWPSVMWSQASEPIFNEDFDIGGIPPIELDVPKYDLTPGHGEQPQAHQDRQDGDPFMASFGFEGLTERF